jgi:PKD repeat protein
VTNLGGSDSEQKVSYIQVLPPLPVADFSATPTVGMAPLTVQFTDLSTDANSLKWYFGDGKTSTLVDPLHTFYLPGTYTVKLVATNAQGLDTEEKTGYITVSDSPVVSTVGMKYVSVFQPETTRVQVWVVRDDATVACRVSYKTNDGTAVRGTDYFTTGDFITFAPGELMKPIWININKEKITLDETFEVELIDTLNADLDINPTKLKTQVTIKNTHPLRGA